EEASRNVSKVLQDVEPEDLIKYGLIPEFVGRLPVVATLEELDEDALVEILTEPKNALTKQYAKLFEMEGVELEFRDDALRAVAKKAMQRKTGARGLRTILENVLLDTMYDLPSMANATKVVVDDAVVTGETKPYVIYESDEPAAVGDGYRTGSGWRGAGRALFAAGPGGHVVRAGASAPFRSRRTWGASLPFGGKSRTLPRKRCHTGFRSGPGGLLHGPLYSAPRPHHLL